MANEKPESPVVISERKEEVIGQPQARPSDPHDGGTLLHEVVVHTDRHILDPNDDLAVQVPEGVGASTVGESPALSTLAEGTAEEQFDREADESKPSENAPSKSTDEKKESGQK